MSKIAQRLLDRQGAAHIRWYILLRWFLIIFIAAPGVISIIARQGWSTEVSQDITTSLACLASNIIFYILVRYNEAHDKNSRKLAGLVLITDIFFATFVLYTKGGIESRSVILYTIPLLVSAILFGRKGAYLAAFGSIASYSWLVVMGYFNFLPHFNQLTPTYSNSLGYVINSIVYMSSILLIIALVADFFSRILLHEKQSAQDNYEALLQAQSLAHIGSWNVHVPTGAIEWSNEMFTILDTDRKHGPLSFEEFFALVHPDDIQRTTRRYRRIFARKTSSSDDIRLQWGSKIKYIHTETQSHVDKDGEVVEVIGTVHDITDSKLLEEAKNDFVSLSSHQLRTPATVVKQYITMLLDGYAGQLTEPQYEFARKANEGNERQLKIINDLLSVVQIDSGKLILKKTRVDLVHLINDVVALRLPKIIANNQTIIFEHRRRELWCNADAERIKLVVENLIDNGSKYSDTGTLLRVGLVRSGKMARISVQDQGVGIAESDIPLIFRKFERIANPLSTEAGGSGLGLYWSSRIVDLHRGKITVTSKRGRGTTFDVYLPISG